MSHVHAVVSVNGSPLAVYAVHAIAPAFGRETHGHGPYYARGSADIAELTRRATSGGPAIMLGDFNMSDISDDYHVIAGAGLVDSFREAGYGFGMTWPVQGWRRGQTNPLIRIDYIWHTTEFMATDAFTGQYATSDHFPIIADLVWIKK
jgi:endonuclease/exonuclease/phosphatase (EEP) superfamily protein YafD